MELIKKGPKDKNDDSGSNGRDTVDKNKKTYMVVDRACNTQSVEKVGRR